MKKVLKISGISLVVVLIFAVGGFFYYRHLKGSPSSVDDLKNVVLNQEEIVSLTKPSIVRIVNRFKGTAMIDLPDFDEKNLELFSIVKEKVNINELLESEYMTGSGSIINKNGYVLTNSHVVSTDIIKYSVSQMISAAYIEIIQEEYTKGNYFRNKTKNEMQRIIPELYEKIATYVLEKSQFNIEKSLVVLRPTSGQEKIEDLVQDGFRAKEVSVNNDFYKDGKDVALIKIDETNLPAIKLGDSDKVIVGNKISVIGFPASAEFNYKNMIEPSYTSGIINAVKDSDKKDFKVFQTDAKVSEGSSGGPIVNQRGELIGVTTYQSNSFQRESGDNFAFGLPINASTGWISDFTTNRELKPENLNEGENQSLYLSGLNYMDINRCRLAIAEFEKASEVNGYFENKKFIDEKIKKCDEIIASGKSIDTRWDELKNKISVISQTTWTIAGLSVAALVLIIIVIITLLRKVRCDEAEIQHMEKEIHDLEKASNH